ncbi:prolyl aminopeptidase [Amycolatopsis sp. NPDC050768]|uniref:prolyl aminopeptidase n=1 Tax=Amycolatopsis sp. NPDC050768 TaxID=3154839 RepID=UPI0033D2FBD8
MPGLHPETTPYRTGMLDVGDGNAVYWEECGNPAGKPALVVHGGPGSGCLPAHRRFFDPDRYRVVLFDQRGCGRSTPYAGEPVADLSANTTPHLLADMELLRTTLGIDTWLLFGGSWGSALSLLYAERHPERVSELVLLGLATDRQAELDLLTRGLGAVFPAAFAKFRDGVPEAERDGDLARAYHRLLMDPDPAVHETAARRWCEWEDAMLSIEPAASRFTDPAYRLAFARLVTHYFANGCFSEDGAILRDTHRLAGIPAALVQGSLDLGNLVGTPWLLERALPDAELLLVGDSGHTTATGSISEVLVGVLDRFARS